MEQTSRICKLLTLLPSTLLRTDWMNGSQTWKFKLCFYPGSYKFQVTSYLECPRFHPNRFNVGGVVVDGGNTVEMRLKMFPIGWSRTLSRIINVWVADWKVKLCDSLLTRAIPERFRDEQLIIIMSCSSLKRSGVARAIQIRFPLLLSSMYKKWDPMNVFDNDCKANCCIRQRLN